MEDTNNDMYIIVAVKKENSLEIELNVYDISGNVDEFVENENDMDIKEENDSGMLKKVYESLVSYEAEECDEIADETFNSSVEVEQKLEEADETSNINKEKYTSLSDTNMALNKESGTIECSSRHNHESKKMQLKYKEKQLAYTYWLKLRKIFKEEGIIFENKDDISTEDVMELCDPNYNRRDQIVNKIASLMKEQVPIPEQDSRNYCLNEIGYFQCRYCTIEEQSEMSIQLHYSVTHGPKYLFCLACDLACRTKSHLYMHEVSCVSPLAPLVRAARKVMRHKTSFPRSFQLACHVCGKMVRRNMMDNHLRSHAPQNMFYCSLCTASFRSPIAMEAHELAHSGQRPFKCTQCPRAYTSRTSLQTHKQTHLESGFTCDICKRCFNRRYTLITHLSSHMGKKRLPCKKCGKKLSSTVSLQNHMRKHLGTSALYKCVQCNKRYPAIYTLRAHMKKKHGTNIVSKKMFFNILPLMERGLRQQDSYVEV